MIDEKKLIDQIAKLPVTEGERDTLVSMGAVLYVIQSQPPEDKWIPCSERPPEEPCIYTVEDCSPYTINKHGEPQRRTIILKPYTWEPYLRVIAWKPINKEPYKGVE